MMAAPGRVRISVQAISILFVYRLAGAFLVSYPAVRMLGAFGPMTSAHADQALFEPGGYLLVEALRLAGHALSASVEVSAVLLAATGILGLAPLALASVTLVATGVPLALRVGQAVSLLPPLLLLGGGTLLLRALVAVIGFVVAGGANALGERFADERMPVLLGAVALLVPLALWLTLGLVQDLARAAVVRRGDGILTALSHAVSCLRGHFVRITVTWALLAMAGLGLVFAAGWIAGMIDVSRPGAMRVSGVLAVHQATVVALVTLRVVWLARTLNLAGAPDDG